MRPNLIVVFVLLLCTSLSAQESNPFELLWRTGGSGKSSSTSTPKKAEVTKDTQASAPVTAFVIPPPEVDPPKAPDTQHVTTIVPDPIVDDPKPIEDDTIVSKTPVNTFDSVDASVADAVDKPEDDTLAVMVPITTPVVEKPVPVQKRTPLVLVLLFGVVFALLAWGMSLDRELLQKIYRAALNENLSSLLYREQRFATTQYLYYTIYIIFFLNAGMFLYFVAQEFGWAAWTFQSIWTCIAMVIVIYLLRHLLLSILGSTYPVTKESTHFSFSILLHNILLGVALIPANLVLAFGPDGMHRTFALIGIGLCGLVYLLRQFRGLLIGGSAIGANPFRFFIYLCAVEILPWFTLVKFFHN